MGEVVQIQHESLDYFDAFWTLIWRREQKKEAKTAWAKIDPRLHTQILTAVAAWRPVYLSRGETRFTPLPATWLNGERWDDEVPPEFTQTRASNTAVVLPELPRKSGEIPAHVLAMIAKLKRV